MKKVAFYTLGCKVNYCDTESLKKLFEDRGYRVTSFDDSAHIYVINTCTVTHLSDRKSRQVIRRAKKRSPHALIVVTGCYAQVSSAELEKIPGVNLVTGNRDRHLMVDRVEEIGRDACLNLVEPFMNREPFDNLPLETSQSRTRAFIKIQEGCGQKCSYCVVPFARGPVRSKPVSAVLDEVSRLAEKGYKELVLTGVHLGMYGEDLEDGSLSTLIRELENIPGIERVRLSSLEPSDFTGELVDTIAASLKVCHHLHIPLQSGSDEILRLMRRPYNRIEYALLIGRLRSLMPALAVSTDIMVGFPGETEENHESSLRFMGGLSFSRVHVFKYSPRPGTEAYDFPNQVNHAVKEKRWRDADNLGKKMAARYRNLFLNQLPKVLIEKSYKKERCIEGLTEHYLRVRARVKENPDRWVGKIISLKISAEGKDYLWGTFPEKS